jgi:hypothetical protein
MVSIEYRRTKAALLAMTFCFGVIGHASMLTNRASVGIDTAGRRAPATIYADNQCKARCAQQASQCDLTCSQGPNALQCAQQCSSQYTQCVSGCN